jgi:hypothetical protein
MLRRIGAEEGGEFKAIASGTLPSGRPVVVNADGTVSVVSGSDAATGSTVAAVNEGGSYTSAAYDVNAQKVVIAYRAIDDSNKGKAVVGTISGTSISFGTAVEFESGVVSYVRAVYDANAQKIVIAYRDGGNSNYGTAIVGTVSGTSISFGSAAVFEAANATYISMTYDSTSQKVVIAYRDSGNSDYGTAIVGTVSGTSISFGTPTVFVSGITDETGITYDSNSQRVVIAYRNENSGNNGEAVVGTVSGTSISFGSSVTYASANARRPGVAYDASAQKVVIAYSDHDDSQKGKAVVGTVSGTSISFGSTVIWETDSTTLKEAVYDSNDQKVYIAYADGGNSGNGTLAVGTVSGTSISFGTPVVLTTSGGLDYIGAAYDSVNNNVIVSFQHGTNNNYVSSVVYSPASTTLTSENYIGMSRGVVTGEPAATGTAVSFESGFTQEAKAVFDTNSNRIVIAYLDGSNSDKGTAVVGTVSGTSISFGTPVIYEQGGTANIAAVFDSSNNKVVVIYQDNGDSGRGKGIVGTVDPSDNSISFGTATQFNSGANNAYNIGAAFDSSNNKVVVAYRDNGNSDYGTAAVGTVSGTSISFGTPVVFNSVNSTSGATVVFDSSNNKVVLAFQDSGSNGYAYVGTVSGTSISFGSKATFNSGDTTQIAATFDSSNNKVVLAYRANTNSNQGTAIVGTISGTSISFGSGVIFNTANTQGTSAVFDTNVNKVLISYEDRGDSDKGKFIVGTVSGTSISFDTETTFSGSNAVFHTGAAFESNANKVVIAYANDTDSSDRGEAIVTNIDSITRSEVAGGGNASVDVIGSVSDNQIGLTAGQQYFVQTDGTISTTAGSPSVLAGTAISATELVVKT